ncbi:MAG: DUF433 domain-containing protein [Fimbriimonas sp.]
MPRIPPELTSILSSDPETLSGAVCFKDTRIPVRILFDHVNHGVSLDEFLLGFPSVSRSDALRVMAWQEKLALDVLEPAFG